MRVPSDAPLTPSTRVVRRYQLGIIITIATLIILLVVLQAVANVFTNYLWFRSEGRSDVWRAMMTTKVELGAFFVGLFFIACWTSLLVVDRVAPRALFMSPELEFVRRYQAAVGGHRFALRTVVSFVVAFAVGSGTASQWQNWLLFLHGGNFGVSDMQFHRDVGFFVFKLPFLSFLVDWTQVALIVLLIVCAGAYYLNAGLRFSGPSPRVDPRATAHLSVIFAALALLRAAAYFYVDRFSLDLTPSGLFDGAGYTSVHVRLPALELLVVVALAAFALLVYNVYARGWLLPAVAAGLWAFVALVVGVLFPAVVQWLQVTPAQSTLELPYITRNIDATRAAYGLTGVTQKTFQGNSSATPGVVNLDAKSLGDVDYWDPSVSAQTLQTLQKKTGYYHINALSLDRYDLNTGSGNQLTPVVIGVREISSASLNRPTWVNQHLVNTHGYGMVMAAANSTASSPAFVMQNIPVQTSDGAPLLTDPAVYFGVGQSNYVVVDSGQAEFNYAVGSSVVNNRYTGSGGIRLGGFWQKAAFALRFHDFNLLVSRLVTPNSRIMFDQDVDTLVQKVAPFLQIDAHPYPVIADGHIDWIVDAYTTTSYYPYSNSADTSALQPGSGLNAGFNYVRNSVKAVVDAYTGKVTLYVVDPSDPILQAWQRVFPGMFQPLSEMPSVLQSHLRYPQDLLAIEATMFGKYHVAPNQFYNNSAFWSVAQTSTGSTANYVQPVYQLLSLPGSSTPTFGAFEPMVPHSSNSQAQNLTAFLVADCSYSHYGSLTSYEIPQGRSQVNGPALANATIAAAAAVSRQTTLLDQHGSRAIFGPTLLIPIDDSLLYVRALFVSSSTSALPQLQYVVVLYGSKVAIGGTLLGKGGALEQVFGSQVSTIGSKGPTNIPQAIQELIQQAYVLQGDATAAARAGRWADFGSDLAQLKSDLQQANTELAKLNSTGGKTSGTGTG